jgi:hypothetical protein
MTMTPMARRDDSRGLKVVADKTRLSDKVWATLAECAYSLSRKPGTLPENSIKRELVTRIARGEIAIQFDGVHWTRDDLLATITGVSVTEQQANDRLIDAKESGDDGQIARWTAIKEATTDYSRLTFDTLPTHIEPRPKPDGTCERSKLELLVSDVLGARSKQKGAKRGPKPTYFADAFQEKALSILRRHRGIGPKLSHGALKAETAEWYLAKFGNEPKPTWIKKHVGLAIKRYDAGH